MRPHRLERWFLANRASVLAAVRRAHGAEAGNRTQAGRLPSDCSATELQRLEPNIGFEPISGRYEGPVLPTELIRLEPSVRIELTSPIYKTGASPAMLTRLGASGRIRTVVRAMARPNPAAERHPLERTQRIELC